MDRFAKRRDMAAPPPASPTRRCGSSQETSALVIRQSRNGPRRSVEEFGASGSVPFVSVAALWSFHLHYRATCRAHDIRDGCRQVGLGANLARAIDVAGRAAGALKVDVTRHVLRRSRATVASMEWTQRGVWSDPEALDEVVNFQRFCKKPTAESALPGFIVTKNVLRESEESASASWLQNDPEDVAIDFCGFVQAKAAVDRLIMC
ncbi:hypothetical protein GQ600_18187 [Phytophthora cactorum]|nr:hypothetical protein GQ600_18187 [Phytophthora cactorum]